jgi:hypothetical protein
LYIAEEMQQRMVWQKSVYSFLVGDYISFLVEQWDLQQLFQLGVAVVEEGVVGELEKDLILFDRN